jgi:hypothetical protein
MREQFKKLILNDKPIPLPEGAVSVKYLKPYGGYYTYLPVGVEAPRRTRIKLNNASLERRQNLGLSCVDIQTIVDLEDDIRRWTNITSRADACVHSIRHNFKWLMKFGNVPYDLKSLIRGIFKYIYFKAITLTPSSQRIKRKAKAAQAFIDNSYFIEQEGKYEGLKNWGVLEDSFLEGLTE